MANTKNFGLIGVGGDLQFGKAGGRVIFDTDEFRIRNVGDTAFLQLKIADPVDAEDAVTLSYLETFAQGLQVKESVRVATTADLAATYNAAGGPSNTGQFTSAPTTIDGTAIAEGDRILVKNQGTTTQNGIYVVTGTTTTWNRAPDFDGTPAAEVSGGAFVFVEAGTANINTGWVLQGSGTLTLNTDAIVWAKFSTQGVLTAATNGGLDKTGSEFSIDWNNLTSEASLADEDLFAFYDDSASAHRRMTAAAIKSFMIAGTSTTTIEDGNSSVAVTDPGTGVVTFTLDGTAIATFALAGINFSTDLTIAATNSLIIPDLSADRVVFTTTGGELTSSANLTFDDTDLDITADVTITGQLDVDDLNLNGNTITTTATDANLIVSLNGTGVLTVVAGSGNYEDNISADDDIPNKKYVDDLIATAVTPGAIASVTGTVDLTTASTQNIGAATGIPANATILRVYLDVTTASDAATTVTLGDATNGANAYMLATENDPQTQGLYIADLRLLNGGTARQATATVATAGSTGTAIAIIEFRYAS
jgi:hypothetical protein